MNLQINPLGILLNRSMLFTALAFMVSTMIIINVYFQNFPRKELFYCWLLVFINAYIGTFIANKAIRCGFTGFYVWAFLINGLRAGLFLILLLSVVKWDVSNVRAFVLMTFSGCFAFLAVEICGVHKHTLRIAKDQQCDRKDD